ncbi:2-succinyl-6-hydroxy-2,4-cyclohexadiene-1-carboxylate synthase [Cricetibacter osteomyelitidis]|nr:2-succinyl-6-hydroxy-2,4-cyclohexadiene-1-carboxylate synthase [Cricetibacter osteomyelitidis]
MYIIFLHGLLGTKSDWQKVIEKLPHFYCMALDLPLHGEAKSMNVQNFDDICDYLADKIQKLVNEEPYYLVGYSLGGRIALYYALQHQKTSNLKGLILEGANLGLLTDAEKQARRQNDLAWATRFAQEPAETVLDDWYQQPVFAHLTLEQRQSLIHQRKGNCGANIAQMLQATSLAVQPDFREKVRSILLPIYYFCGEKDQKFRQMALANQLNLTLISNAGHNAHSENPAEFAQKLEQIILAKNSR